MPASPYSTSQIPSSSIPRLRWNLKAIDSLSFSVHGDSLPGWILDARRCAIHAGPLLARLLMHAFWPG
jgi:hypothetical protein